MINISLEEHPITQECTQVVTKRIKVPNGALVWKMGRMWGILSPDTNGIYSSSNIVYSPNIPEGIMKIPVGRGSLKRSVQMIGTPPLNDIDTEVNMGWVTAHITFRDGQFNVDFKGGGEASVKRWSAHITTRKLPHPIETSAIDNIYNQLSSIKPIIGSTNYESKNAYHKQRHLAVKIDILTHYGNGKLVCVRCGFNDIRALSIDHISGKGNLHRTILHKNNGSGFYYWLKNNDYPEGYQTLCMNCQWIKRSENSETTNSINIQSRIDRLLKDLSAQNISKDDARQYITKLLSSP